MVFTIMTWVWIALIITFALLEAATVGLISIWFSAGAVAALITCAFTPSLTVQIAVFLIVSAVCLVATRPLVKRYRINRHVATNADSNVGRKARVIVAVSPDVAGRVRLDGVDWLAYSDETLAVDSLCVVTAVEGAKLHVASEMSVSPVVTV